ncbi:gamma carbonic anhydrase family protein [Schumannella luteola]|uniref:Carbonic anhydrase/acetyltransferase-like protein (Isoleucine patch superfamily) n=1 Tax=Schumannella luteola TaxID=472059 RepID=A0A852YIN5_9MICO|nr:gamma carbonic anhydrase family protein [Schumannella luteola]NYG98978.1 carbonic anhydrase/acetyltransferase-like protein (isoleucine patch superfamily) [Schumannella luteola]TPX06344.1 gamma carbonic anhydrase family protein [Schumannella luteola]
MALILPFDGDFPEIHPTAFIAPNATIIGRVRIAAEASVWYGTVLRGDLEWIDLGEGSNIQDNSVVHTDLGNPTVIGAGVGIGHAAIIHGTTIGDGALVGMGSRLLSGSKLGARALLAAGAVLLEGHEVPDGHIAAGVPAKVRGEITDEGMRDRIARNAVQYRELARAHRGLEPREA